MGLIGSDQIGNSAQSGRGFPHTLVNTRGCMVGLMPDASHDMSGLEAGIAVSHPAVIPAQPAKMVELSREECLELLRSHSFGRVAVNLGQGPPLIRPASPTRSRAPAKFGD